MDEIWFWQRIVSPHMAGLAVALARLGNKVTYVAEQNMSPDRAQQGWMAPPLSSVRIMYATNRAETAALAHEAPETAIHICQGIRANGIVGVAQRALAARNLRSWVVMETVNDAIWSGALKRVEYARLFHARRATLHGVLASGHRTADWIVARGVPRDRVYPFAYFLRDPDIALKAVSRSPGPYRFAFVGRLIKLKRVDWLVKALSGLRNQNYELWIVGAGPEEEHLRRLTAHHLGNRVRWMGQLRSTEVSGVMAQADCLVLPSIHDGWGAVASESMLTGTPVICSDTCGVGSAVIASGKGGVFPARDSAALANLLAQQLDSGSVGDAERRDLAAWAGCLGATAGAKYLVEVLAHQSNGSRRPLAPWLRKDGLCAAS